MSNIDLKWLETNLDLGKILITPKIVLKSRFFRISNKKNHQNKLLIKHKIAKWTAACCCCKKDSKMVHLNKRLALLIHLLWFVSLLPVAVPQHRFLMSAYFETWSKMCLDWIHGLDANQKAILLFPNGLF
jgi:hypothetical protein